MANQKTSALPKLKLPIKPPFAPMEALRVEQIPEGSEFQYEPKWDGFRAIIFRDREQIFIQSKSGQSLGRYFPELIEMIQKIKVESFIVDGEIILLKNGKLSFDELQLRLHPAESRIQRLAKETPVTFQCFDLLYWGGMKPLQLVDEALAKRRVALEKFFKKVPKKCRFELSPATRDFKKAKKWYTDYVTLGLDGIMAKRREEPYHSGDRKGMMKVKHLKSADCVVAGYRKSSDGKAISALTLGLYDKDGKLNHVGSTSSFSIAEKKALLKKLHPLEGGPGFTGKAPGKSRWSKDDHVFIPLKPKLVCEVRYDYFTEGRFRHGTKFLRWRDDKKPALCDYSQL